MVRKSILSAVATLLAFSSTFADEKDRLLGGLSGTDDLARADARQILPRFGMDAVPELLELMHHEDALVWRAAKNVLQDIAHRTGTAGREKDRRDLSQMLLDTALSDGPRDTRKHALRLLGIAAPDGFRVKALKVMAKEGVWRGEIFSTLVIMATPEAKKVLDSLVGYGTGQQRAEVIEALRLITPAPEAPVSERLLRDDNVEVRVAAMRALSQTGNKNLEELFLRAIKGTEGRLQIEAQDACLRLSEAISRRNPASY